VADSWPARRRRPDSRARRLAGDRRWRRPGTQGRCQLSLHLVDTVAPTRERPLAQVPDGMPAALMVLAGQGDAPGELGQRNGRPWSNGASSPRHDTSTEW